MSSMFATPDRFVGQEVWRLYVGFDHDGDSMDAYVWLLDPEHREVFNPADPFGSVSFDANDQMKVFAHIVKTVAFEESLRLIDGGQTPIVVLGEFGFPLFSLPGYCCFFRSAQH